MYASLFVNFAESIPRSSFAAGVLDGFTVASGVLDGFTVAAGVPVGVAVADASESVTKVTDVTRIYFTSVFAFCTTRYNASAASGYASIFKTDSCPLFTALISTKPAQSVVFVDNFKEAPD